MRSCTVWSELKTSHTTSLQARASQEATSTAHDKLNTASKDNSRVKPWGLCMPTSRACMSYHGRLPHSCIHMKQLVTE